MLDEIRLALDIVHGLDCIEVSGHRSLRIDDDEPLAWKPDDCVWAESTAIAVESRLRDEINVRGHAGQLHHRLELLLAPATTSLRSRTQRADKSSGLDANCVLGFGDAAQLGAD